MSQSSDYVQRVLTYLGERYGVIAHRRSPGRGWIDFASGCSVHVNSSTQYDRSQKAYDGWYDLNKSIYDEIVGREKRFTVILLGNPEQCFILSSAKVSEFFQPSTMYERNLWHFTITKTQDSWILEVLNGGGRHEIKEFLNRWEQIQDFQASNLSGFKFVAKDFETELGTEAANKTLWDRLKQLNDVLKAETTFRFPGFTEPEVANYWDHHHPEDLYRKFLWIRMAHSSIEGKPAQNIQFQVFIDEAFDKSRPFGVGIWIDRVAPEARDRTARAIVDRPTQFVRLLNQLSDLTIQIRNETFEKRSEDVNLGDIKDITEKLTAKDAFFFVGKCFTSEEAVSLGGNVVSTILHILEMLTPLYMFLSGMEQGSVTEEQTSPRLFIAPASEEHIDSNFAPYLLNKQKVPSSIAPGVSGLFSVEGLFSIDDIADVLSPDEKASLESAYADRRVRMWAGGAGTSASWKMIRKNDYVIFYSRHYFIYLARVSYATDNQKLSNKVWGPRSDGKSWNNVFFVADVKQIHIPQEEFNRVAGYDLRYVPQGFSRVGDERESKVLEWLQSNYLSQTDSICKEIQEQIDFIDQISPLIDSERLENWTTALKGFQARKAEEDEEKWRTKQNWETLKDLYDFIESTKPNASKAIQEITIQKLDGLDETESVIVCAIRTLQGRHTTWLEPNMNAQKYSLLKREFAQGAIGFVKGARLDLDSPPINDTPLMMPTKQDIESAISSITETMLIEPSVIREVVANLVAGKNVILSGPVGTGKTELAQQIPKLVWKDIGGYFPYVYTATADWSTGDIVGGIYPRVDEGGGVSYDIRKGCVYSTIWDNWDSSGSVLARKKIQRQNTTFQGEWLVIDEFNRANIDRAFGEMFTAIEYGKLSVPSVSGDSFLRSIPIPKDYRIIATLNNFDKHFLFRMSDALKRRFGFVEVLPPRREKKVQEMYYSWNKVKEIPIQSTLFPKIRLDATAKTVTKEGSDEKLLSVLDAAYEILSYIRTTKNLGTAILISIYKFVAVDGETNENLEVSLDMALRSSIVPQLENVQPFQLRALREFACGDLMKFLKSADKESMEFPKYVNEFKRLLLFIRSDDIDPRVQRFQEGTVGDDEWAKYNPWKDVKRPKLPIFKQALNELLKEEELG